MFLDKIIYMGKRSDVIISGAGPSGSLIGYLLT